MPKKTKIKLEGLKVESFITDLDAEDAKGGRPEEVFTPDQPTMSTCTCISCLPWYCTMDVTCITYDTCVQCPTMSCPYCDAEPQDTQIIRK